MLLTDLPFDVLVNIALELAVVESHGPPKHLVALLLTCRSIYEALGSHACPHLYARIFRSKFDTRPIVRRFGSEPSKAPGLCAQLKLYCTALRRIRGGDIAASTVEADMWCALFMMLENDGRNEEQLEWAGCKDFIDRYVRERLFYRSDETLGWPAESKVNALALWLMWFTLDEATVTAQTPESRRQLMELVRPYVVVPVRYPTFYVPDCVFEFPIPEGAPDYYTATGHGYYPPYRSPETLRTKHVHYGRQVNVCLPPLALSARLLYFALSEATPFPVPANLPVNRDAARAQGITQIMPTQADYILFNQHKGAAYLPRGSWDWYADLSEEQARIEDAGVWRKELQSKSSKWDNELWRMMFSYNPWKPTPSNNIPVPGPYTYGSLEGKWMGRMLMPDANQYFNTVMSKPYAPHQPAMTTVPISMSFREYHCISPATPLAAGGPKGNAYDGGSNNAWVPGDCEIREAYGNARVYRGGVVLSEYEHWTADQPNSHKASSCQMCIDRVEAERRAAIAKQKKRKTIEDSDDEYDDDSDSDSEDDGASQGSSKRARRSRTPVDINQDDPSHMEVSGADTEVENVRAEVQRVMGLTTSSVDEVIDAMMGNSNKFECRGIQDVIILGETLPRHGQAWHHYRFYGRVRAFDGLLALVRIPVQFPELGVTIFRGYLVGGQNLVGNWRAYVSAPRAVPLEGPFIASRAPNAE